VLEQTKRPMLINLGPVPVLRLLDSRGVRVGTCI